MLQFRLRTLFIATTASAVTFWALFAPPQWLGLLAIHLLYFLLPALTISGIIFHRGYWRAFFIGMAPWIVMVSFWISTSGFQMWWPSPWQTFDEFPFREDPDTIVYQKLHLAVPVIFAIASGLVGVGICRWALWLERQKE